MQVAQAQEMQHLDKQAIHDCLIPGMVLMENAGRGTVQTIVNHFGPVTGTALPIFVGPGNNGGDGLVIARAVHELGGIPLIFFLTSPDNLQGDARTNCEIVIRCGLPATQLEGDSEQSIITQILDAVGCNKVHCMVDAIFGTGLRRDLKGVFRATVLACNQLRRERGWPIIAADVPSGLNTDTAVVHGVAINADLTTAYGLPKPVHYLHGPATTGQVEVIPIGIPGHLVESADLKGRLITATVKTKLHPKPITAHKGSNGHLLILAGSTGKTGAALLCARGALHSGIGLVTLAVPAALQMVFEAGLVEAMTVPLPNSSEYLDIDDDDLIFELLEGKDACVIGPGLGTKQRTRELVHRLYREVKQPMVVDADALNLLAQQPQIIDEPGGVRILTPHPGEMARLIGKTSREIQHDRIGAASWKSGTDCAHALVTVLKGAGTVVSDTTGRWALNTTGNPGMATGGMGDVLAGLIASLTAQGYSPWKSACMGVYLHGLAADRLSCDRPAGFLATEVAEEISRVLGSIQPGEQKLASRTASPSRS
ncbi:MAG: bifunctional ADP-dependent NAD(P)H-hydrate dehydratase/NAD(P)H-hydrate epimerase [Desulfobulbus propionicus]|nr:MAG: bifunctional ADP-dependent NAD(P)H-hydrate dehydratase/NAD(P)H-hydrate epimerase [Desulfobulbus propionicus]